MHGNGCRYCGGSWLLLLVACLLPIFAALVLEIAPLSWRPLGDSDALYKGISDLYDSSSEIWEHVWGEHMHTGYYDNADGKLQSLTKEDHLLAQVRMMEELFRKWDDVASVVRWGFVASMQCACVWLMLFPVCTGVRNVTLITLYLLCGEGFLSM